MKKISIVITTWNSAETIYSCIDSILNQTYPNLEILVLDAGSTDNTLEIVKWVAKENSNLTVCKQKNASVTALRKKGLAISTGEFVCFVQPEDIYNRSAFTDLSRNMELYDADIAMASFIHSNYKKYHTDTIYNLTEENDFYKLHQDFISCATLSGKLFKKELFNHLTIKEIHLREEIMNLVALLKAKRLISLKKVLCVTQEHKSLFEAPYFWENQQSFWFKCKATSTYCKQIYINLKPKSLKINIPRLTSYRTLDYLIWELLSYAEDDASIEQIAMELYRVLKDSLFQEIKRHIEFEEFKFREMTDEQLLAACLHYADTILKQTDYIRGNVPQADIVTIHYMLFIKLFYRQTGYIDSKHYLCYLRESLNLNDTLEAKIVNQFDLN